MCSPGRLQAASTILMPHCQVSLFCPQDLGPMTPLGLEMMDALTKQDITFSVLSAAQLGNRRWLQALRTYFLQAEEVSKPQVLWRPQRANVLRGCEHA